MAEQATIAERELGEALRAAMRGFAQSVVIITTTDDAGTRFAMAATAVTPLSMNPPSMLICVNRVAASHRILQGGANFCLNILGAAQVDVGKFNATSRGEARFTVGDWRTDEEGLPYLADAQAVIRCHQRQTLSHGSHDIFIGDVQSVRQNGSVDPLIYLDGQYRAVGTIL